MCIVAPGRNLRQGAEWPPSWNVQPHGISVGRYIDPTFMRLEYERLWSRVWQVAARLDEVPGFVGTPMLRASDRPGALSTGIAAVAAKSPMKRPGRPEDIAAAAAFLASEEAGYITGHTLRMAGAILRKLRG